MDDEGEAKSAQAYQALGQLILCNDAPIPDIEATRALDYFSNASKFDPEFLPWPRDNGSEVGKDLIQSMRDAVTHASGQDPVHALAKALTEIGSQNPNEADKQAERTLRHLRDLGYDITLAT